MHLNRLFIILGIYSWYFFVRSVIYGLVSGRNIFGDENSFEFWWSFLMAIPVSILLAGLVWGFVASLIWIFKKD